MVSRFVRTGVPPLQAAVALLALGGSVLFVAGLVVAPLLAGLP